MKLHFNAFSARQIDKATKAASLDKNRRQEFKNRLLDYGHFPHDSQQMIAVGRCMNSLGKSEQAQIIKAIKQNAEKTAKASGVLDKITISDFILCCLPRIPVVSAVARLLIIPLIVAWGFVLHAQIKARNLEDGLRMALSKTEHSDIRLTCRVPFPAS